MPSERTDEKLLVRYLLGELSEEEQARVEDRAFNDREFLGALEAVETDLIDEWVRGELPAARSREFESRFLTSPGRRSKVEFARALAKIEEEFQSAAAVPSNTRFRLWNPAFQIGAGLACLVLVAAAWLARENAALRSRIASNEAQHRGPELRPAVASLILAPGATRAEAEIKHLDLNPSTQIAHIDIQIEPGDVYPRFRVVLSRATGEELLAVNRLSAIRDVVTLEAPASLLTAGRYELALQGVDSRESTHDLGFWYFDVRKLGERSQP